MYQAISNVQIQQRGKISATPCPLVQAVVMMHSLLVCAHRAHICTTYTHMHIYTAGYTYTLDPSPPGCCHHILSPIQPHRRSQTEDRTSETPPHTHTAPRMHHLLTDWVCTPSHTWTHAGDSPQLLGPPSWGVTHTASLPVPFTGAKNK